MPSISFLTCALPCCQQGLRAEETKIAKFVRITSVVLGLLISITGILLFTNVFGINQITLGYALFALGIPLILAGALLKCAQPLIEQKKEPPKKLSWTLTDEERATLEYISTNPQIRAGSYIGEEIINAYECMRLGIPETFTISKQHDGHGTHTKVHNNATDLLKEVVQQGSALFTLIEAYQEKPATRHKAAELIKIVEKTKTLLFQTKI